jgi:hypothetical protein
MSEDEKYDNNVVPPKLGSALTGALVEVQSKLPTIMKSQTALVPTKSGGTYSYKYADLASISEAVLPVLASAGLAWVTLPTYDEEGRFVLGYALRHTSGEELRGMYPLPDSSSKPQEIGSAITYARRYALCSVVGVVPDEDDDGGLAQNASRGRSAAKPRTQAKPARAAEADNETGEIPEPPNVSAAIEKLDQDGRKELQTKLEKANMHLDSLSPAAAKQVVKWAEELLEAQKKREPF